jgi:predicted nucleic acid-binding protein
VTLVVDANALVVQADRGARAHEPVVEVLRGERGRLIVSAFVVQEADYLIQRRMGVDAELLFLRDLEEGTYVVDELSLAELGVARELVERYRDLQIGLADASLVILAAKHGSRRVLTLDERHFRAIEPLQGGHFTILPADA